MHKKWYSIVISILLCTTLLLAGCTSANPPASAPSAAAPAPSSETPAAPSESSTAPAADNAESGLIIGALYGGPITDSGYNQAMHESVMAIQANVPGVKIIEAENVPDEAGATSTIENMIQQGAKLIFATGFNHQYPALELAAKYPDVKFEHAGGWEVSSNFGNFFGSPQDSWYLMGIAAGMMTETNKIGFIGAFPMGWTATFINSFALGIKSVNPDAQVIVAYTFSWGDRAKEADTTNSLINQGTDIVTMHVDSPATIVSTAESRGVYSIGYQSLEAQKFAPEYWISGTGFTLGKQFTDIASSVVDGTWQPAFKRWRLSDGSMAIAPFGPNVPQNVQDAVNAATAELNAGKLVVFKGPIKDQDGNIKVPEGEVLAEDLMSATDWFVDNVVGQAK